MIRRRIMRNRGKALMLAVAMCGLAACGVDPGEKSEGGPEIEPGTENVSVAGTSAGTVAGGDDVADGMSASTVEKEEFTMIRIKEEYFDIRRRGDWLELHNVYTYGADYPELDEGGCAKVVADVDVYSGGAAGYMNDYYLRNVKSWDPVTYDDIAAEFELPDAGETNINMYNHMLVYHDGGDCYLICLYQDMVEVYKDGEVFAEYALEDIEGLSTPEPFLNVLEERKAFAGVPDEKGVEIYIPESVDKTILVSMTLKDITPTGLTVHFNQYNRADCGELIYGEGYHLQVLKKDVWEDVPTIIEDWGFTDEGYILPAEGEADLVTDWEWLYGELAPGTYRITKTLLDSDQTDPKVNIPAYPLTAQFIIADSLGRIKTYEVTDPDLSEEYIAEGKLVTMVKYYEMINDTWQTDEHAYKYRLVITGRMNGAAQDSTFVYLSNLEEITFEQAWKAAGLSSNSEDYFAPEEAVLVAIK